MKLATVHHLGLSIFGGKPPAWFSPSFPESAKVRRVFRDRCGGQFEYVMETQVGPSARLFVLPVINRTNHDQQWRRPHQLAFTVQWRRVLIEDPLAPMTCSTHYLSHEQFRWFARLQNGAVKPPRCERESRFVRLIAEEPGADGKVAEFHFIADYEFSGAMRKLLSDYLALPVLL